VGHAARLQDVEAAVALAVALELANSSQVSISDEIPTSLWVLPRTRSSGS
jgi:hypothetical protein